MILYDCTNAPNPYRVRMFMAEKGIDMEIRDITIMKGEHFGPDYKKKVPASKLPALELDDGTIIRETSSICRYLERIQPEPNLLGVDAKEEALIDSWSRVMEFELMMPLAMAFRHLHPAMGALEKQSAEYGEICKGHAAKRMAILNKELGNKDFIAGDRFTLADVTGYAVMRYFPKLARVEIDPEWTNLTEWMARISERPSTRVYEADKAA